MPRESTPFMIGKSMEAHPEIVREVISAGTG